MNKGVGGIAEGLASAQEFIDSGRMVEEKDPRALLNRLQEPWSRYTDGGTNATVGAGMLNGPEAREGRGVG